MRTATLVSVALAAVLQFGCTHWNKMTPGPLDNTAITAEVKKNLLGDGLTGVDVDVTDGVVTLSGHLPTNEKRTSAVHDAKKVDAVRRVVDHITVP